MNLTNAASCLKPFFPKTSKAALSLALRPEETGVTLTPKAKRLLFGSPKPRKKANSLRCRVSDERFAEVQKDMKNLGLNTQDYLEFVLDWYLAKPFNEEAAPSEDEAASTKGDETQ